jgi:hypothetical protein
VDLEARVADLHLQISAAQEGTGTKVSTSNVM